MAKVDVGFERQGLDLRPAQYLVAALILGTLCYMSMQGGPLGLVFSLLVFPVMWAMLQISALDTYGARGWWLALTLPPVLSGWVMLGASLLG